MSMQMGELVIHSLSTNQSVEQKTAQLRSCLLIGKQECILSYSVLGDHLHESIEANDQRMQSGFIQVQDAYELLKKKHNF